MNVERAFRIVNEASWGNQKRNRIPQWFGNVQNEHGEIKRR